MSANLFLGQADPAALVAAVTELRVDLLAVQELTPELAAALDDAGLRRRLPYGAVYPAPGAAGSAVYSRHPLTGTGVRRLVRCHTQAYASITVPGARPLPVESAHPCAPSDRASTLAWAREMDQQPRAGADGVPRVLLGDFNSTLDHGGLRRVVGSGYRDAAATLGAGLEPTWPFAGHELGPIPVPPVTLDHVLADPRIGIAEAAVRPIVGSDHRAVIAELVLPADPAPAG
jgi:endonuclease/exonuclease/phosphatase family metal-dependent hydrolase